MSLTTPLWQPSSQRIRQSNLNGFIQRVTAAYPQVDDYDSLYRWSIERSDQFWSALWDFSGVVSTRRCDRVLTNPTAMPGAVWFEGARLNFAENLLRFRDDRPALIFRNENGVGREHVLPTAFQGGHSLRGIAENTRSQVGRPGCGLYDQ